MPTYTLSEYGERYAEIEALDAQAALAEALARFDASPYQVTGEGTTWIEIKVYDADGEQVASRVVRVDPVAPDCADSHAHAWRSPLRVVGGIRENPGVWGHGAGVVITECCAHCGVYRDRDTAAQDYATGEPRGESLLYRDADEVSLDWVRARRIRTSARAD